MLRNYFLCTNKLECLVAISNFSLVYYFQVEQEPTQLNNLTVHGLRVLSANVRLGCKYLPNKNTLAYFDEETKFSCI